MVDLEIDHWGLPRPGRTVGFSLWNGTGFRGLVAGTPASIPLPQCPGCTAGVSGVTTAESINLQVPNHPSMIGVQLAFQGFDIGTGPCLGAVRLSDTVDVTIQ